MKAPGTVGRNSKMTRIHIIGPHASGKSTLAYCIGTRVGVPVYSLDDLAFDVSPLGGVPQLRPLAARLSETGRIAAGPTWVTEGTYLRWTRDLLDAADLVIWLDVPWRVAAWRILSRHVHTELRLTRHPHTLTMVRQFWRTVRYYRDPTVLDLLAPDERVNRATTAQRLAPYAEKTTRLRATSEVDALVERLALLPARTFEK